MYLSRLEIENFRGIRSARIEFGESTVLIGENDSGKTTLLEAICIVLSPRQEHLPIAFQPRDFFMEPGLKDYQPAGPLGIHLTFRERKPDEWSFLRNNELGLFLPDDVHVLQELTLDVMAKPGSGGEIAEALWRIRVEGRSRMDYSADTAVLSWIRRLNPVFRIRSGILDNLPDGGADLHARYNEALKNLEQVTNLFIPEGPPLEQIIYEILGKKQIKNDAPGKKVVLQHGSAAEKIGLLLFTTALLQSGSLMADPSAEPIIIIEDPEAHLHPMTLQSVKLIIERIRWQKILTTQSGDLLSDFPLQDIRRISRHDGNIRAHWVKPEDLSREELRRLSYHVRMRLSTATFARCWLLVEGESEVWLLPHIARLCGYDLAMEGVVCVEFAQCGMAPLIKAASQLGIEWFLLADGDAAGKAYIETAKHFARQSSENPENHSMRFRDKDIEHHLFFNGYEGVYQEYSGIPSFTSQNMQPRRIIGRAIHRNSKPFMAVAVVEAMSRKDSPGVPPELRKLIENCVRLAKGAPGRA